MSSRSVEDFLSIENQLYTCYYYARLESPTTDVRSDNLFDSDCMRLYRFFSCVGKFISFWNITPSSSYEYIYRTVDLSKYYYSRLSYYMLRSQYTDLVGLVDLDEELVDFLIAPVIEDGFNDFGYRMSVIPAEAFFADYAILVEGQSELIFYKTLAKQIDIDLDRLNISILSVEGVGFKVYAKILDALKIEWVARTDNDIIQIPKKDVYRFAGVERGLELVKQSFTIEKEDAKIISDHTPNLRGFSSKEHIPEQSLNSAKKLREILETYNVFIADVDLETDLCNSSLKGDLKKAYGETLTDDSLIKKMKGHKATNMFDFLRKHKENLKMLEDDNLAKPLLVAKEYIEEKYGTY